MEIECPFCQTKYEVVSENIGKKMKCSSCDKDFIVENPNLIPCPDCFSMISKRALFCPHCGAAGCGTPHWNVKEVNPAPDAVEEKEIFICHPSCMNYFWTIVLGVITSILIIGLFVLLYVWIDIHYTSYRITNLRIIIRRGWIAKFQNEIWIKDMRGANLVQSIWQRIINVGNISIGTAATAGTEICMVGIGNPQNIVDMINSLRK